MCDCDIINEKYYKCPCLPVKKKEVIDSFHISQFKSKLEKKTLKEILISIEYT